jgi:hypothetical protein
MQAGSGGAKPKGKGEVRGFTPVERRHKKQGAL